LLYSVSVLIISLSIYIYNTFTTHVSSKYLIVDFFLKKLLNQLYMSCKRIEFDVVYCTVKFGQRTPIKGLRIVLDRLV